MNHLTIHSELNADAEMVTTVIGELDAQTVPELRAALTSSPQRADVVDCRFVTIMTAAGVSVLCDVADIHPIRVVGSVLVERVLEVCDLGDRLHLQRPEGSPCLEQAPFGVAVHDSDLRYLYVNDALAEINGVTADEHYGRRPHDLFDVDHDDLTPQLRAVLRTRQSRTIRVSGETAAHASGSWTYCCRPARFAGENGPVDAVVAIVAIVATDRDAQPSTTRLHFRVPQPVAS